MDDNPLHQNLSQKYRVIVIAAMKKLTALDSSKVTDSDREMALKYLSNVNVSSIFPFTDLIPTPSYDRDFDLEDNMQISSIPRQPTPDNIGPQITSRSVTPSETIPKAPPISERPESRSTSIATNYDNLESYSKIEGDVLHIYGEPNITPINYGDYIVHFHNLDLERICEAYLFPKKVMATTLIFSNNRISTLKQLSLLSKLEFDVLKITFKDNPVCTTLKRILKPYCIYILPQLTEMNGKLISVTDKSNSEKIFGKRQAVSKSIAPPISQSFLDRYSGIVNNYINSVLNHTYVVEEKMKLVDDVWDQVLFEFIVKSLSSLEKYPSSACMKQGIEINGKKVDSKSR